MLSLVGTIMIFLCYEDGFDGELIPGERVIVFDRDGEDAYRVHPVRRSRVEDRVTELVFGSELGTPPAVVLVG